VAKFIACLEQFIADHKHLCFDEHTPVWVCAYANNQHDVGAELSGSVLTSSFVRAIYMSDGTLTIADANGTVLTRAWCALEVYVSVEQRGAAYLHNIYTAGAFEDLSGKPVGAMGLVSGFAKPDINVDEGGGVPFFKALREKQFPALLVAKAERFDLQLAEASQEADKAAIMEAVGADARALNATLQVRFSIGLLPQMLEGGDPRLASFCTALKASVLRALSLYSNRERVSAEAVRQVSDALPPSLVDLRAADIGNGAIGGVARLLARGQLQHLQLSNCTLWAADASVLAAALGERGVGLRELNLQCARCWLLAASSRLAPTGRTAAVIWLMLGRAESWAGQGLQWHDSGEELHSRSCQIRALPLPAVPAACASPLPAQHRKNGLGLVFAAALAKGLEANDTLTSLGLK
jgi:hypothetical protein